MPVVPWVQPFPTGWQQSRDNGATWGPPPAPPTTTEVQGPTGSQRFRVQFAIPSNVTGTFTATVSGDIFSAGFPDPAHLYYDGVDRGPVTPPRQGPITFTLPATPGAHTIELWIGQAPLDNNGLTRPTVAFNFDNASTVGNVPCDCCPTGPPRCARVPARFVSVSVAANPAGLPITNLNSTIDGTLGSDLSGFSPPSSEAQLVANPTTAFDYVFAVPAQGLSRIRWWNGGGTILTDQDGFGAITVTFLDAALTVLATMPWDLTAPATNNVPPRQLDFPKLYNVDRIRFSGFHKQNPAVMGTGSPLLRQVEAYQDGPVFPCLRRNGDLEWYDEVGNLVPADDLIPCTEA